MVGLIVLCVAMAVGTSTLIVVGVARRSLAAYEARYLTGGVNDLTEMFFFVERRQLMLLTIALATLLGLLAYAISNWLGGIFAAVLGFWAPIFGIRALRRARLRKFERQFVDALNQLAAALRAGLTVAQASESVAEEAEAPLGQELGLFLKELKLGVSQEDALQNLADRVGSEDLQLMVTATNVSARLGGNMAEMFDTIAATIRERFRLEGRIRALTAQGKLQGWIVGAMPVVLGVVLNYMRPDLMKPMLSTPFGYALIGTVATMEVIGIWLIRRIVAVDV